jgi:tripartite-type tricarboxylate transporter receptor subunit TctC
VEAMMKALAARLLLALLAVPFAAAAQAQYPNKPIRLVIPFVAAGPTDTVARTVAQAMSKSLGQSIVIDNKPGADGAIAAQTVVGAAADGYTLLFATSSVLALSIVGKPVAFDPLIDLSPVSTVGHFTYAMYVYPGLPAQSVKDFIAYGRANPGKLSYGASNVAEYLAAVQFMKPAGIEMLRVPYKGQAQMMPDLIAGRVQVSFGPLGGGLPLAKDGRVRILAVSPQRSPLVPEVPTMAEAGIGDFYVPSYQMILAPAKTPSGILERLSREVNAAVQIPEVRAQLEKLALVVKASTPQALTASIREGNSVWARYARDYPLAAQ